MAPPPAAPPSGPARLQVGGDLVPGGAAAAAGGDGEAGGGRPRGAGLPGAEAADPPQGPALGLGPVDQPSSEPGVGGLGAEAPCLGGAESALARGGAGPHGGEGGGGWRACSSSNGGGGGEGRRIRSPGRSHGAGHGERRRKLRAARWGPYAPRVHGGNGGRLAGPSTAADLGRATKQWLVLVEFSWWLAPPGYRRP